MYKNIDYDKYYELWKQNEKGNYVLNLDNVLFTVYKKTEKSKFYYVVKNECSEPTFYPNPFLDFEQAVQWLYDEITINTDLLRKNKGTRIVEWDEM